MKTKKGMCSAGREASTNTKKYYFLLLTRERKCSLEYNIFYFIGGIDSYGNQPLQDLRLFIFIKRMVKMHWKKPHEK